MIRAKCDCCGEEKDCDVFVLENMPECNVIVCLDCQEYAIDSVRVPESAAGRPCKVNSPETR